MNPYTYYVEQIRACKLNDSEAINAFLEMAEADPNVSFELYGRVLSVAHDRGYSALNT